MNPGQDMILRSLRHGVHYHLLQCSETEEVCSMTAKLHCASPSYLTMHVLIYIHVHVLYLLIQNIAHRREMIFLRSFSYLKV